MFRVCTLSPFISLLYKEFSRNYVYNTCRIGRWVRVPIQLVRDTPVVHSHFCFEELHDFEAHVDAEFLWIFLDTVVFATAIPKSKSLPLLIAEERKSVRLALSYAV